MKTNMDQVRRPERRVAFPLGRGGSEERRQQKKSRLLLRKGLKEFDVEHSKGDDIIPVKQGAHSPPIDGAELLCATRKWPKLPSPSFLPQVDLRPVCCWCILDRHTIAALNVRDATLPQVRN